MFVTRTALFHHSYFPQTVRTRYTDPLTQQFHEIVKAPPSTSPKLLPERVNPQADPIPNPRGLLELKARAGNPKAQLELATFLYENGDGLEDKEMAFDLAFLAATKSLPEAELFLCKLYTEKENLPQARTWLIKAAHHGSAEAQYDLSLKYQKEGMSHLFHYFCSLAAEQEHAVAQLELARAFYIGEGCEIDENEALNWLIRSADNGHPEAVYCLAFCYAEGDGVEQDIEKAMALFDEAAPFVPKAYYYLGGIYAHAGLPACIGLYMQAAENDVREAQLALGLCYEIGLFTIRNIPKAIDWYTQAAENGLLEPLLRLFEIQERGHELSNPKAIEMTKVWDREALVQEAKEKSSLYNIFERIKASQETE